jgi:hypothetical protein
MEIKLKSLELEFELDFTLNMKLRHLEIIK